MYTLSGFSPERKQFFAILRILRHLLVINNFSLVRLQVMLLNNCSVFHHNYLYALGTATDFEVNCILFYFNFFFSSMEEFFKHIPDWLTPSRASYGNPRNTYSNNYRQRTQALRIFFKIMINSQIG